MMTPEQKQELRRTKLKTAAKLRAEIGYKQALERVDYKLDVMEPEMQALDALAEQGELGTTKPELGA